VSGLVERLREGVGIAPTERELWQVNVDMDVAADTIEALVDALWLLLGARSPADRFEANAAARAALSRLDAPQSTQAISHD
jgi:hypothetical protein